MTEFDYKSFTKRYYKFKDCNLPVPFWDEERQVKEYVYYEDREDLEDWKKYNVSVYLNLYQILHLLDYITHLLVADILRKMVSLLRK